LVDGEAVPLMNGMREDALLLIKETREERLGVF
jgi:hypothetical protein